MSMIGAAAPRTSLGVDLEAGPPVIPCLGVCCGRSWDVRDYFMGFAHAVSFTGIFASLGTHNSWFAVGFGVTEGTSLVVHGLMRKYGDLSAIVDRFTQATRGYERTIQERAAAIQASEGVVSRLTGDVTHLEEEKRMIEDLKNGLERDVEAVRREAAATQSRCDELGRRILDLQTENTRLQETVVGFQRGTAEFAEENRDFREGLGVFAEGERLLEGDEERLREDAVLLDKEITLLTGETLKAARGATELQAILQEESRQLALQVAGLGEVAKGLGRVDERLAETTAQRAALHAQDMATRGGLEGTLEKLERGTAALTQLLQQLQTLRGGV